MRFNPDRCLVCGTPNRPHNLSSKYKYIDHTGSYPASAFWFCSEECIERALESYMPSRYHFDNSWKTDPELTRTINDEFDFEVDQYSEEHDYHRNRMKERLLELKGEWEERKAYEVWDAETKLSSRINAEDIVYLEKVEEERRKEQEKSDRVEEKRLAEEAERLAEELARTPRPFVMPPDYLRFSATWIVAPQGRGKTTLLHHLFLNDIQTDASIILMDSKGDLIDPIRKLAALQDRLVVLEPDANFPLALNPLNIGATTTHTISFIEHLFTSLLETKATPMQALLFRSILIALQTIPNASFATFREFLVKGWRPYEQHIRQLHPDDQSFFFDGEFDSKLYADRRQEVLWRIRDLMTKIPILRDTFSSPTTKINMGALMDSGKVIIINNSKKLLGDEGAEFFGRFFIAMIRAAADQRSGLPDHAKRPVYFYIDECHAVIKRDEKIASIIDECRSQKISLILSHQRVDQIDSDNVLSAISNSAIRYANSDDDAKYLADKLRTTPEFLRSLKRGVFAAYMRDAGATIPMQVPFNDLSKLPQMTANQERELKERMQAQFSFAPVRHVPPQPTQATPPAAPPPPPQPNRADTPKGPNMEGALHWEVTINPRIAEAGGEIPLIVDRGGQPVKINVKVSPQTRDGAVMRLQGYGNFRKDKTRGDLYLKLHVPPYPEQNPRNKDPGEPSDTW